MASPPADPLRDKLRRLRREEGGGKGPGREATVPAWLRRRLGRDAPGKGPAGDTGPRSVGEPADLEVFSRDEGEHAARIRTFTADHRHGDVALGDVVEASRETIALVARDPALEGLDPTRAVYLDIETTGLSGGAGTIPFLVALGSFCAEASGCSRFEMWQGFLRGPEEERALLAEVARRIRAGDGVVSFFGKSFDRHRLEDKMLVHGIEPPFEGRAHLDLYHPLRRLYGGAFEDGRLGTMEHELAGVQREDDLPGSFAPAAWFDFLGGRAHRLEEVFQHNLDDVLSLVTLAAHLGDTVAERRAGGGSLPGPALARARGLARLFAGRRDWTEALRWVDRALERDSAKERPWLLLRADLVRRTADWGEVLPLYEEIAEGERDEIAARALIEVAKLREHRAKDFAGALDAVGRARDVIRRAVVGSRRSRLLADCDHRASRLRKR